MGRFLLPDFKRQLDRDRGADTDFALQRYAAAHTVRQLLYDGKPQTRTLILRTAGFLFLREHIKGVLDKLLAHTDAFVLAAEGQHNAPVRLHFLGVGHRDRAARRAEFDGIVRNVGQNSAQIHRVTDQRCIFHVGVIPIDLVGNALARCLLGVHPVQFTQSICHIEGQLVVFQIAALDLVHIQHVVYQRHQIVQRFQCLFARLLLHFGIVRVLLCQIDHTDNAVQRCADVVAHRCQEAGFHFRLALGGLSLIQ